MERGAMTDEQESPLLSAAESVSAPADLAVNVVLVALDGSDDSFYAFHWYMQNIHQPSHSIIILHCPEIKSATKVPLRCPDSDSVRNIMEQHQQETADLASRIKENLKVLKVNARFIRQSGNPGHVIVEVANESKATLIVTGTRGHNSVRRTLIGSVSDYVLHHAHCPVLICRKETAEKKLL